MNVTQSAGWVVCDTKIRIFTQRRKNSRNLSNLFYWVISLQPCYFAGVLASFLQCSYVTYATLKKRE